MKVVVFPGVGFQKNISSPKKFIASLKKEIGFDFDSEIFVWEHWYSAPIISLPLKSIREWTCEVLLDFQQVVVHALEMKVPKADLYVGHSAGSILALVQNKPCISMASPAALVELIDRNRDGVNCDNPYTSRIANMIMSNTKGRPVLNIINLYDVLAYPINSGNVENYECKGAIYNPLTYFPLCAHTSYWKSKEVIMKVAQTIKDWHQRELI
jgi:hypothetical protein